MKYMGKEQLNSLKRSMASYDITKQLRKNISIDKKISEYNIKNKNKKIIGTKQRDSIQQKDLNKDIWYGLQILFKIYFKYFKNVMRNMVENYFDE